MLDKLLYEMGENRDSKPVLLSNGLRIRFWKRGPLRCIVYEREGQHPSGDEAHTLRQSIARTFEPIQTLTTTEVHKYTDATTETEWFYGCIYWIRGGVDAHKFEHMGKQLEMF